MQVVLVCLGNFQSYILYSIQNLLLYGNNNIVVITEPEFFPNFAPVAPHIKLISRRALKSRKIDEFEEKSRLCRNFRGGFWHLCSMRFFYLYAYMKETGVTDVVHIENDVMVYENLGAAAAAEFNFSRGVYAPFDCDTRVIPSFVYIYSWRELEPIIRGYDYGVDDMKNLARFGEDVIQKLPIIWPAGAAAHNAPQLARNFRGVIFDAAAIGQYLGGVDKKNDPADTRGFVNETCLVKYDKYKFYWLFVGGKWAPYVADENENIYKIINLHIHSKELENFLGGGGEPPAERELICVV